MNNKHRASKNKGENNGKYFDPSQAPLDKIVSITDPLYPIHVVQPLLSYVIEKSHIDESAAIALNAWDKLREQNKK